MRIPVPDVRVDDPSVCGGVAVFPLYPERSLFTEGDPKYILVHEAISAGTVIIREVSEAGSVPEVMVNNDGELPILILEGEELRGAKQNRMAATTVLVGAKSRVRIPVSCVEQRRWRYDSRRFTSGSHCPPSLRHHLKRMAGGGHGSPSHQTALWAEIRRRHGAMGVSSTTDDLSAALETHRERVERVQEQLPYPPSASGVAVAIGGKVVSVDIFDTPETLAKTWDRLVQGLALDALEVRNDECQATATSVEARLYAARELRWSRTHIAAHPQHRWLFQTKRCGKFSARRVEQIVKRYAEQAGIQATPHVFRHQCITFLTKTSGLADAELQLITGHARRETLAVYQHVAVDGQLAERYQAAMKEVDL